MRRDGMGKNGNRKQGRVSGGKEARGESRWEKKAPEEGTDKTVRVKP